MEDQSKQNPKENELQNSENQLNENSKNENDPISLNDSAIEEEEKNQTENSISENYSEVQQNQEQVASENQQGPTNESESMKDEEESQSPEHQIAQLVPVVQENTSSTSTNPVGNPNEEGEEENLGKSRKVKRPSKSFVKSLATNVSVGVISSLLTVSLVSYFDIPIIGTDDSSTSIPASSYQQSKTSGANYTTTFTKSDQATIADIAEELSPTIVGVVNYQATTSQYSTESEDVESGSGSGVIYSKDDKYGYIITNNHVVEGASSVKVSLYSGETVDATIVGADALTDLAVLRIDQKYVTTVATFGDSSNLRAGDDVVAIGNPLGLDFSRTVTQGIVSATDRTIEVDTSAGAWELTAIQTDAAINPGNSGGPLINSSGEVIGITSLKISETGVEGLGFAIPSNDVIPIVEELIQNGEITRAYLGVEMYDLTNIADFYRQSMYGDLESGVVVAGVQDNSPAAKAGLQVNDVIVGIDGNEVTSITDLRKYLYQEINPGDAVKIEFYRDGTKQSVTVTTTTTSTTSTN